MYMYQSYYINYVCMLQIVTHVCVHVSYYNWCVPRACTPSHVYHRSKERLHVPMDRYWCAPCFSNYRRRVQNVLQCTHRTGNKSLTRLLQRIMLALMLLNQGDCAFISPHYAKQKNNGGNLRRCSTVDFLCTQPVFCEIHNQSLHKVCAPQLGGRTETYLWQLQAYAWVMHNSCKDDTTKEQQIEKVLVVNRSVELLLLIMV